MNRPLKNLYTKYDQQGNKIQKSAESKQYLLLLYQADNSDIRSWEIITGRKNVLEYLIQQESNIDFENSMILVDSLPFSEAQMLHKFVRYCLDKGFIEDYDDTVILYNAIDGIEDTEE